MSDELSEIRDILRDRLTPAGAVVELDSNSSAGKFKVRVRAPGASTDEAGEAAYREFVMQMAALEEAQHLGWRETLVAMAAGRSLRDVVRR